MKSVKIIIPESPPTDNHLYGQVGHRRFMYPEGKEWKEMSAWCAKQAWKRPVSSDKKFRVETWFYLKRERDIQGSKKVLFDSFEGIIYANDKQVFNEESFKVLDEESKLNPRVEVFVREI